MNHRAILLLILSLLLSSCAVFVNRKPLPAPENPPAVPDTAVTASQPAESSAVAVPRGPLLIIPAQSPVIVDWGKTTEVQLDVSWIDNRSQAVQIAPGPDTPSWLVVELRPAIVQPPAATTLRISATAGAAVPGPLTLVLEASGYGLEGPVPVGILVNVQRQGGEFQPVQPGPLTHECRNVCGQVRNGQLMFFDILKERGQTCTDAQNFPESQRLGGRSFTLAPLGFAYGHTCGVAAVYEASGQLSFINLGLSASLARGAVLATIRGVSEAWLSPDNTLALVRLSNVLVPYDVISGRELGGPCRIAGSIQPVVLRGDTLTAGACSWRIQ